MLNTIRSFYRFFVLNARTKFYYKSVLSAEKIFCSLHVPLETIPISTAIVFATLRFIGTKLTNHAQANEFRSSGCIFQPFKFQTYAAVRTDNDS